MIELYCGDGKGKTTASVGLAIRAAGHKIPVYFYQFMKDGSSGEIEILKTIPGIHVKYPPVFYGFVRNMTKEQKEEMKDHYMSMLQTVNHIIEEHSKEQIIIVLDEIIHACNYQLLPESELCRMLKHCSSNIETILTGRNPSQALLDLADYVSDIQKVKHPFDQGLLAREGIEF
ncbi:MAG: cob(I)yrinic acid a,c-diamide adenosyltransferase [Lachnospiraceae bacterium]|nr:cob(I)yrinic acid a,c-diamide adenosyltransferase [Lachnospiraceae bacterium]